LKVSEIVEKVMKADGRLLCRLIGLTENLYRMERSVTQI
jgi:hypothetical protein